MAHIHEKIDFTASVFIVHGGKVLLHLHKKLGKWLQPGGHIELDEDPNQAAIREAKEETGFEVELVGSPRLPILASNPSDIVPPKFLNRHRFNDTHEHIDCTYFGRVKGGSLTGEDGVETRWFSREEVTAEDNMPAATKAYALAALDELS